MSRRLWIDTRGLPVITTTSNGENNAVRWGWTPATARPLPTLEEIADTIYKHAGTFTEALGGPVTCRDCGTPIDGCDFDNDLPSHQADAVLALLKGKDR